MEEAVAELKKASTSGLSPNGKPLKPGEMTSDEYAQERCAESRTSTMRRRAQKRRSFWSVPERESRAKPGAQSADEYRRH